MHARTSLSLCMSDFNALCMHVILRLECMPMQVVLILIIEGLMYMERHLGQK